ncbi:tyrosine-protein phosphatase non-receptor type 9-like [Manduca sexta]|uniref:tyrosine-protein phosphatase non-receptor type 9-like n=1 Tax=Manduca sexta TaxID=7130 RepID=UPI00188EE719|nr:tyrosine-protein phosphatase non-receptor type 9-like [Manduca sexta]
MCVFPQPTRDATGAAIAVFTANKHFPSQTTHQTTLQGVVYQLDVALQSPDTQRAGLVFIYDMTDSKYTNFDYELSQKILTMLKVSGHLTMYIYMRHRSKRKSVILCIDECSGNDKRSNSGPNIGGNGKKNVSCICIYFIFILGYSRS